MARLLFVRWPLFFALLVGPATIAGAVRPEAWGEADSSEMEDALSSFAEVEQALRAAGSSQAMDGPQVFDAPITDANGISFLTSNESKQDLLQFDIYLSDPPEKRWKEIAEWSAQDGTGFLARFLRGMGLAAEHASRLKWLGKRMLSTTAEERAEIEAFAKLSGETAEDVAVMQAIYALSSACTSIVAEGEDGTVVHARNMDFNGAAMLRRRTFLARWFLDESDLEPSFESVQFAGHLGVFTGMGNGFSIAVNQRASQGMMSIKSYALGAASNWVSGVIGGSNVAYLVRKALEECRGFDCAVRMLAEERMVAPVYLTIAGSSPGQGVLLERDRGGVNACFSLAGFDASLVKECQAQSWFLTVGNFDESDERSDGMAFSRRNMAAGALRAAGRACRSGAAHGSVGACRASERVLEAVLRWGFVTQVGTVYRTHMLPKEGVLKARLTEHPVIFANTFSIRKDSLLEAGMLYAQGSPPGLVTSLTHPGSPCRAKGTEERIRTLDCAIRWKSDASSLAANLVANTMPELGKATPLAWSFKRIFVCPCLVA